MAIVSSEPIQRRWLYVQATTPTGVVEGQLWYDIASNMLKSYDGSSWNEISAVSQAELTALKEQDAIHSINILRNSAADTLTDMDYSNMYVDVMTDSTGYSNTIDTGNTTATFTTDNYHNTLSIPGNLIMLLKLNESSGNAIDSVGNHDGVNTNVTYSAGQWNNGANFAGDTTYLTVADHDDIRNKTAWTIECWFKTTQTNNFIFFDKDHSNAQGIGLSTCDSGNVGKLRLLCNNEESPYTTANTYNDGAWHFAVITMDGSHLDLWVDGSKVITAWAKTPNLNTGSDLYLGFNASGFTGSLDSFRFFDDIRTDEEIATDDDAEIDTSYSKLIKTNSLDTIAGTESYTDLILEKTGTTANITYDFSRDNSTWQTGLAINTKNAIIGAGTGTGCYLKINLDTSELHIKAYSLILWD